MAEHFMKDLFSKKKYDELMENFYALYEGLYLKMLDSVTFKLKEEDKDYENDSYFKLSAKALHYYPGLSHSFNKIGVAFSNSDMTYLESINVLITEYMNIEEKYKDHINDVVEEFEPLDLINESEEDEEF